MNRRFGKLRFGVPNLRGIYKECARATRTRISNVLLWDGMCFCVFGPQTAFSKNRLLPDVHPGEAALAPAGTALQEGQCGSAWRASHSVLVHGLQLRDHSVAAAARPRACVPCASCRARQTGGNKDAPAPPPHWAWAACVALWRSHCRAGIGSACVRPIPFIFPKRLLCPAARVFHPGAHPEEAPSFCFVLGGGDASLSVLLATCSVL